MAALFLAIVLAAAACGSDGGSVTAADSQATESTSSADVDVDAGAEADEAAPTVTPAEAPAVEPTEVPAAEAGELSDLDVKPVAPLPDGPVSELGIEDVVVGDGLEATAGSSVSMRYVGVRAADGIEFDSSWARPDNQFDFVLGVGQVIPGWDQGIAGMKVGGRRVLTIPSAMAYGPQGAGADIPPNTDLVFVADLLSATEALSEADHPEFTIPDVAPTEVTVTDLTVGTGDAVTAESIVSIQLLAAVQSTGEITTSTWRDQFGQTIDAPLNALIPTFVDAMVGMQPGGVRQIDIPEGPDGLDANEAATVVVELVDILG